MDLGGNEEHDEAFGEMINGIRITFTSPEPEEEVDVPKSDALESPFRVVPAVEASNDDVSPVVSSGQPALKKMASSIPLRTASTPSSIPRPASRAHANTNDSPSKSPTGRVVSSTRPASRTNTQSPNGRSPAGSLIPAPVSPLAVNPPSAQSKRAPAMTFTRQPQRTTNPSVARKIASNTLQGSTFKPIPPSSTHTYSPPFYFNSRQRSGCSFQVFSCRDVNSA